MRFLTRANRDLRVIYAAGLLRSTGVGLTGVLLGVYLSRAGFSATQIGIVITAGLAASALGTLVVSVCADRLGRRRTLIGISLLSALGGLGFALTGRFSGFLLLSFIGTVNGMGTDRGPAFTLDQALISQTVSVDLRTTAFSWHSLIMYRACPGGARGWPSGAVRTLAPARAAHLLQNHLRHIRRYQRPDRSRLPPAFARS